MKIFIYSLNYFPELTGVGKYSGELAEWLSNKGHEVRVVAAPPYYPDWKVSVKYNQWAYKKEKKSHVSVIRCPLWVPKSPSGVKRILHLVSFALSSFPVVVFSAFWKPDVIIVIEPPLFCSPAALVSGFLSGSKNILHIQDFEVDAAFDLGLIKGRALRKIVQWCEKFIYRRFDRVSTISHNMLSLLEEKGVDRSKRFIFPNWVNTEQIFPDNKTTNAFRKQFDICDDTIVALYSGNMGEKQGLEIVIDAANKLQTDPNIVFVMCGGGAAFEKLKNRAHGVGNIHWLPLQPIELLNELLNMADIHLLPQKKNIADLVMPSKLTGMLASGKPVLATADPGTQVWKMVKECGISKVNSGDLSAFVTALVSLANNKEERKRQGKLARDYAEKNLEQGIVLSKFESELISLTNS